MTEAIITQETAEPSPIADDLVSASEKESAESQTPESTEPERRPKKHSGLQRRFNALTRRLRETEAWLENERRNREVRAEFAEENPSVGEKEQAREERREREAAARAEKQAPEASAATSGQLPDDFDAVIDEADRQGLSLPGDIHDAIAKMPDSQEIIYFLAKNPEMIDRLAGDDAPLERVAQLSRDLSAIRDFGVDHSTFEAHDSRVKKVLASLPDGKQVMAAAKAVIIPQHVATAILENPNSEQVALHLARNPKLAAEMAQLTPSGAAVKIGKIAAELERPKERKAPPPPIRPVDGSTIRIEKPRGEMTPEEYMTARAGDKRREAKARALWREPRYR